MDVIINSSKPALKLKKVLQVEVNCPNCDAKMNFDGSEVDIGNIVKCKGCDKKTYYPFEKPWYRKKKLFFGYLASVIFSFVLGLIVNYVYDLLKK